LKLSFSRWGPPSTWPATLSSPCPASVSTVMSFIPAAAAALICCCQTSPFIAA
jgi:hypothetical protein